MKKKSSVLDTFNSIINNEATSHLCSNNKSYVHLMFYVHNFDLRFVWNEKMDIIDFRLDLFIALKKGLNSFQIWVVVYANHNLVRFKLILPRLMDFSISKF